MIESSIVMISGVGSGPRESKEVVVDAFDLQSVKGGKELDCVGGNGP